MRGKKQSTFVATSSSQTLYPPFFQVLPPPFRYLISQENNRQKLLLQLDFGSLKAHCLADSMIRDQEFHIEWE